MTLGQDTINIPESDLFALEQENLDSQTGIDRLEKAAVSLYKAILSTRDSGQSLKYRCDNQLKYFACIAMGDMAAANERVADYEQYSSKFSKRLLEFLTVMFKYQVSLLLPFLFMRRCQAASELTGGSGN